nr:MAG TPA: hypothetical protein [Caudoviricetes sp.]
MLPYRLVNVLKLGELIRSSLLSGQLSLRFDSSLRRRR